MKNLLLLSLTVFLIISCKKTEFAPEGPTDIRIRNKSLSDTTFYEVTIRTSENEEDLKDLGDISSGDESDYVRVTKSYIDIEVYAKVNIGGTLVDFTTGEVDFTYLHYIGQERYTFEVKIADRNARKLKISNRIPDEPLVVK